MINEVGVMCCGCTACADICPQRCIEMKKNEEGFLYPIICQNTCIRCGMCQKVCPVLNTTELVTTECKEAWGVISKDKTVLINSSSGGLFTALAEAVMEENGSVFGAAFSDDYKKVRHVMVEEKEDLSLLRGSKYVQSDMGNCFRTVKDTLKHGKRVMFSGTPCQIAGLQRFLGKDGDAVIFVDVICHGIPSATLWERYLSHVEGQMGGKAKAVSFRQKEIGGNLVGMDGPLNGNLIYYRTLTEEPFMQMYLKNYCLRESCYNCRIKETGTVSDITIGDFWGVEEIVSEIDGTLGVSLALIHTRKGKELFEKVKPKIESKKVDYDAAIAKNNAYQHSVVRPPERDRFYFDLRGLKWKQMEKRYIREMLQSMFKKKLSASVIGLVHRKVFGKKAKSAKINGKYGLAIIMERIQ